MNHIPLMARFNAWANERIYDCAGRLSDEDYRADRKAFFGSVHATLNHILVVDRLWSGRIDGQDRGIRSLDQVLYDDFGALWAARQSEDRHLVELVDGLDEKSLEAAVRYRRIIGEGEEEARTGHILITLFNHQTHHRGQVHTLLTQCDIDPPPLDVLYFLYELGETGPPGTIGGT